MPSRRLIVSIALLFIVLMTLAAWWAGIEARHMARLKAAALPMPIGNPLKGTSEPTFAYFFTVYATLVSILMLIPAMAAFVLRRPGGPGPVWLVFWTAAWLAFAVHLDFAVGRVLGGLHWVFHDTADPPRVTHPIGDSLISLWWTADVILAWFVAFRPPWVQMERGALHMAVFSAALSSSIVLSSHGIVRAAGIALLLTTTAAALYRVVVYPFDPTSVAGRLYKLAFRTLNRLVPWYGLPTWGAVFNLGALRVVLREFNLHDTSGIPVTNPAGLAAIPAFAPADMVQRNMDGFYNDFSKPAMGSSSDPSMTDADSMYFTKSNPGARFGRNVPLAQAFPDPEPALLTPSPRLVSTELLARRSFIPAPTLNYLAAAWIQFETHDWFNHGEPVEERTFAVPLANGDPWGESHGCPMHVRATRPDPTRDYDQERAANRGRLRYPPTYANAESHWWDASQIYGSNHETTARLRAVYRQEDGHFVQTDAVVPDGKLFLDHDGLMLDPSHLQSAPTGSQSALTGFTGNWWAGLSLLHTLFAREHNAICDELKSHNPHWSDDQLFNTARMVNSALMAKIHTVEWTPAILAHPALEIGMPANWWGLETERLYRAIGRISQNEAFSGIPLSGVDHSGADYCLTEEFVSVYRLHPLLRDDLPICSARDGRPIQTLANQDGVVGNLEQLKVFQSPDWDFADVFYSFGRANPGAITIHNYPAFLRELTRPDGEVVDLATIDILRDRERGVPRYNRFLQLMHKPPIRSFDDLANPQHPGLPKELRRIYGRTGNRDNVDKLDLMVGLFCETPPPGFGFSDTAFRVFILMASRRLKSDRFIAKDFVPEVYTEAGIAWVNNTSFAGMLRRHFPELRPALHGVENGFKPWRDVSLAGAP